VRMAEIFGHSTERLRAVPVDSAVLGAPRPKDMSLRSDRVERLLGRSMPSLTAGLARLRDLRASGWPQALQAAIDAARG
jgi:dTDP-4-dehydrorhamnose reductase